MTDSELLELLKSFIETESITGNERGMVNLLSSVFSSLHFETVTTPSGCICGVINGREKGKTVLVDGHIDTVGIPDKTLWSVPPFSLTRKGGLLYGRGTSDMKGGVAAAIAAASSLLPLEKGRIVISCTVEEERFEGLTSREVSSVFNPDYVIIAESTHGKINIGQRGRAEILIKAHGRSCHSSNPEEGENAVMNALKAVSEIDNMSQKEHPVLGAAIMVLTDIISSPYPGMSIVPEMCRVTYDRRTFPEETKESVIEPLNRLFREKGINAEAEIAFGETVTYTGRSLSAPRFFPSWCFSEKDEIAVKSRNALEEASLFKGYGHYSFCTNGSHYAGEKGIPTIGYGPGEERFAHIVDEHIEESDLYETKRGMEKIIKALLLD